MKTVGFISLIVLGVIAVGLVALGIRMIPDIQRYLKIRNM